MSDPFSDQVTLRCRADVGGRQVEVRQSIARPVYDDPIARKVLEAHIRQALMMAILEEWTPVIEIIQ